MDRMGASEPLPRVTLFVAERAAEVGDHHELMWEPSLAERAASDLDAPRRARALAAGEECVDDAPRLAVQERLQPELRCLTTGESLGRLADQSLTGAIHETQGTPLVERENGDVDLLHDATEQRGRLERTQPLIAQRVPECVDLEHGLTEGVVEAAATRADGIIALS